MNQTLLKVKHIFFYLFNQCESNSHEILGLFEEDARNRLRELSAQPEFNDQLSMVSIVGSRGVGKSTVCSLLSGNSSMFDVKVQFLTSLSS